MKHIIPLTQAPKPADSIVRLMLETKYELMEENTFLKDIY